MAASLNTVLLTPAEMAAADAAAAASGLSSFGLMLRAGHAVAAAALRLFPGAWRFVVLCGPGNNGGDGYIAATALEDAGAVIAVFAEGDPQRLKGDAESAFRRWGGAPLPLATYAPQAGDVVIDALFGAGLARDLPPDVQDVIAAVTVAMVPVIAVDLPSGLCGRRGTVQGAAFRACHTVTFMTRKPGHLLLPGRQLCGTVETVDIGIPARIIDRVAGSLRLNGPAVFGSLADPQAVAGHKYSRGHLAVLSGPASAGGAARLAAMAGLKAGAGLVTVLSPEAAVAEHAAHLDAVMLRQVDTEADFAALLADRRLATVVLGPGFGRPALARAMMDQLSDHRVVLDADGLTAFREAPERLFARRRGAGSALVLTPHDGEFRRLFADFADDTGLSKVERALAAAARAAAVVVLKGADTVIAAPDGRVAINDNAPPQLATAGSGDVLAGIIGGLLARGLPAYEAAAAGVFLHGEAGRRAGPGMNAEDLVRAVRPQTEAASG